MITCTSDPRCGYCRPRHRPTSGIRLEIQFTTFLVFFGFYCTWFRLCRWHREVLSMYNVLVEYDRQSQLCQNLERLPPVCVARESRLRQIPRDHIVFRPIIKLCWQLNFSRNIIGTITLSWIFMITLTQQWSSVNSGSATLTCFRRQRLQTQFPVTENEDACMCLLFKLYLVIVYYSTVYGIRPWQLWRHRYTSHCFISQCVIFTCTAMTSVMASLYYVRYDDLELCFRKLLY